MTEPRSRRRREPTTPKRGPGRPAFEPTDEQREAVSIMAACGIPADMIARIVVPGGIARPTLDKYFRDELDTGHDKANAAIAETLFRKAIGGDTACMIFWLKTRARWKEVTQHEVTGQGGGPIDMRHQIDAPPRPETPEEWLARRQRELSAMGAAAGTATARDRGGAD